MTIRPCPPSWAWPGSARAPANLGMAASGERLRADLRCTGLRASSREWHHELRWCMPIAPPSRDSLLRQETGDADDPFALDDDDCGACEPGQHRRGARPADLR